MSKRAKIASLMFVGFLTIALLSVIAFLAFGRDALLVLKDAGLILGVFIVPAVLATVFVVILQRLAMSQTPRNNPGRHD